MLYDFTSVLKPKAFRIIWISCTVQPRQNISSASDAMNMRDLPSTVKDALSLLLPQVDSLRIIQDDPDHKAIEIPQMPSVYSQAMVTIATSRAKTRHEGFLQDRLALPDNAANLMFELPYWCEDSKLGPVTFLEKLKKLTEPLDYRARAHS